MQGGGEKIREGLSRARAALYVLCWPVDPRRQLFWWLLLLCGLAFRFYAVLVFRNPMDVIFSDPSRHWDNAKHFWKPGPQGAGNPYLYQLYLYLLQQATHDNKLAMGIIAAVLSATYPLIWYGFARTVFRRRINALRFGAILCWIPSHVSVFSFFLNETLLLPLIGLALWLTSLVVAKRSPLWFVLAATTWTAALLTRSVVGPIGLACVVVSWLGLRRLRWTSLAVASAIAAFGVGVASVRAQKVLGRYTPFGDNEPNAIYFISGAHDYTVDFKYLGTYVFASPSLYVSPFYPYAQFKTIRQGAGTVSFRVDPALHGEDLKQTLRAQRRANWRKFPRLVYENLIFLSFGHSWPMAGSAGDQADQICLKERWIWLPLTIVSLVGSIAYIVRRKAAFVPVVTIAFIVTVFGLGSMFALMEGRYRKPLEPIVLLAPLWLWEARRRSPPVSAKSHWPKFWSASTLSRRTHSSSTMSAHSAFE